MNIAQILSQIVNCQAYQLRELRASINDMLISDEEQIALLEALNMREQLQEFHDNMSDDDMEDDDEEDK